MQGRAIAIVPAYNEEKTVADVIGAARASGLTGAVLVVDDGSTDRTKQAAEEAGAEVLRLEVNGGKAGAVLAAVRRLRDAGQAPPDQVLALLDADLVGLRGNHVADLLNPVVSGEADMTIGLFSRGRSATDLAQKIAPFLSGQRAVRLEVVARALEAANVARFGIEMALSRYAKQRGLTVKCVRLEGVTHVMKEEKMGFFEGAASRLRMYRDIAAEGARMLTRGKGSKG